jgi:hypothetical protein
MTNSYQHYEELPTLRTVTYITNSYQHDEHSHLVEYLGLKTTELY